MREIKFRAWDNQVQKMWSWEDLVDYKLECLDMKPGVAFLFLQFTGLLDENSKEIYEGDVFTFTCGNCDVTHRGEIIWIDDLACWGLEEGSNICPLQVPSKDKKSVGLIPIKEVIGNIYENPELIK